MPPTKTPTGFEYATAAAADGGEAELTTVPPSNAGGQVLDLLGGYLTIIVVVTVIVVLVLGLIGLKIYTTWATRASKRRRHSSQRWLTEDNPQIWTDKSFDDGEIVGLSAAL